MTANLTAIVPLLVSAVDGGAAEGGKSPLTSRVKALNVRDSVPRLYRAAAGRRNTRPAGGQRADVDRVRLSRAVVYNRPFGNSSYNSHCIRGVEMTLEKTTKRPERLRFEGRVLYLTE